MSPPLGLRLEDGGGITPFWRVMIALTGLGMVALAALLLLTCSWAKPKHLIVGKVSPTRAAGEALPSTPSATSAAAATGGEEVRPQAAEHSARGSRGGGLPRRVEGARCREARHGSDGGGGGDAVPSDGSGRGDGGDGDGSDDAVPGDPAVPVAAEGGSCAPQE